MALYEAVVGVGKQEHSKEQATTAQLIEVRILDGLMTQAPAPIWFHFARDLTRRATGPAVLPR